MTEKTEEKRPERLTTDTLDELTIRTSTENLGTHYTSNTAYTAGVVEHAQDISMLRA